MWTSAQSGSLQFDLPRWPLSSRELPLSCVCLSCSPQAPQPQAPETPWADEENVVYHLTDEDFDKFIKDHSSVLVMFHAPCEFVFSFLLWAKCLLTKSVMFFCGSFTEPWTQKSRLFLFVVIVKYTRHEMFVKLLTSRLGWRCASGRGGTL